MTIIGMSWGLRLSDLTPLAKLVAVRLGDGCSVDGTGSENLAGLAAWCCADQASVIEALTILQSGVEGFSWQIDESQGWLIYQLPDDARPQPRRAQENVFEAAGTLYIVRGRMGRKIGITRNMTNRLEGLRSATLDETITLEWSSSAPMSVVRRGERLAHELLAANLLRNEWFAVSLDQAKAAAHTALQRARVMLVGTDADSGTGDRG